MAGINFDTSGLDRGIENLRRQIGGASSKAVKDVATEILRLSQFEVPHDKGLLQNSGMVEDVTEGVSIVGYNKEYASYQHEGRRADGSHVVVNYGKGRKGKYLEDPIKNNLNVFSRVLGHSLKTGLNLV